MSIEPCESKESGSPPVSPSKAAFLGESKESESPPVSPSKLPKLKPTHAIREETLLRDAVRWAIDHDDAVFLACLLQLPCDDLIEDSQKNLAATKTAREDIEQRKSKSKLILHELLCFQYELRVLIDAEFPQNEHIQSGIVYVKKNEEGQGLTYTVRSNQGTVVSADLDRNDLLKMGLSVEYLYPSMVTPAHISEENSEQARKQAEKKLRTQKAKVADLQQMRLYLEDSSKEVKKPLKTLSSHLGSILKVTAKRGHTHDAVAEEVAVYSDADMSVLGETLRQKWIMLVNGSAENAHTFLTTNRALSTYNRLYYLQRPAQLITEEPHKRYLDTEECRAYLEEYKPWLVQDTSDIGLAAFDERIKSEILTLNTPNKLSAAIKAFCKEIEEFAKNEEAVAENEVLVWQAYHAFCQRGYQEAYPTQLSEKIQKIGDWLAKDHTEALRLLGVYTPKVGRDFLEKDDTPARDLLTRDYTLHSMADLPADTPLPEGAIYVDIHDPTPRGEETRRIIRYVVRHPSGNRVDGTIAQEEFLNYQIPKTLLNINELSPHKKTIIDILVSRDHALSIPKISPNLFIVTQSAGSKMSLWEYATHKQSTAVLKLLKERKTRNNNRKPNLLYLAKMYLTSNENSDQINYETAYQQATLAEKQALFKKLLRAEVDQGRLIVLLKKHGFNEPKNCLEIADEDKPLLAYLLKHLFIEELFIFPFFTNATDRLADQRKLVFLLEEPKIPIDQKEALVRCYEKHYKEVCWDDPVLKDALDSLRQDKKAADEKEQPVYTLEERDYIDVVQKAFKSCEQYCQNRPNLNTEEDEETLRALADETNETKNSKNWADKAVHFMYEILKADGFTPTLTSKAQQQKRVEAEGLKQAVSGEMTSVEQLEAIYRLKEDFKNSLSDRQKRGAVFESRKLDEIKRQLEALKEANKEQAKKVLRLEQTVALPSAQQQQPPARKSSVTTAVSPASMAPAAVFMKPSPPDSPVGLASAVSKEIEVLALT